MLGSVCKVLVYATARLTRTSVMNLHSCCHVPKEHDGACHEALPLSWWIRPWGTGVGISPG